MERIVHYFSKSKKRSYLFLILLIYFLFQVTGFVLFGLPFIHLFLFFLDLPPFWEWILLIGAACSCAYMGGIVSAEVLALYKKRSEILIIPVSIALTSIIALLWGMWWFLPYSISRSSSETIIFDYIMHFIIPNITALSKCIAYLEQPHAILIFCATLCLACIIGRKKYLKKLCNICGNVKTEDMTPILLFPANVFEAMKTDDRDLSLLENLEVASVGQNQEFGIVKITSCENCHKSIMSIEHVVRVMTSNGIKRTSNMVCVNVEVDYDWAQKLIKHYRGKYNQKHETETVI